MEMHIKVFSFLFVEPGSTDNYRVKSPALGAYVKLLDLGKALLRVFL